ncbi:MAG: TetR/AcrR family transcriptional regulator [Roseivirga sp.]|nr:TetR/AcrR family transcriptional regulator [Roseivirga sp.]
MPQVLNNSYEELVQKAQELFWIKGYKGASVKDLADYLNVSTSTIYNKYSKEMLFIDSLEYYNQTCSDPFLKGLRDNTNGLESLRDFFYALIDALLDKSFPRSCLMVNTVVELRNENPHVTKLYDQYFDNLVTSYNVVLDKAIEMGEIKFPEKRDEYSQFLLGVIFSLSILFKINEPDELRLFVDEQLAFIK